MNKGIKGKIMWTQFLQIIKVRIDKKFSQQRLKEILTKRERENQLKQINWQGTLFRGIFRIGTCC